MEKTISKKTETINKYKKLSGHMPPIIMGISDEILQETLSLILAEQYLDGYKKGKKKYKRFKHKFVGVSFDNERLKIEIEELTKKVESLQEKQIANVNRMEFMKAVDSKFKEKELD